MKRILCLIAALLLPTLHLCAEEPKIPPTKVQLQLLDTNILDVLGLYSKWTGRKVWVALDLYKGLNIRAKLDAPVPLPEAIQFLRTTLLERYTIELRDSGDKEVFASYSDDPKYEKIREALRKGLDPEPAPPSKSIPKTQSPNIPTK